MDTQTTTATELVVERDGAVAVVTLCREAVRNTLTVDLVGRLKDTIGALEQAGDVRVVIIRGAGDRSFSAGFDITAIDTEGGVADDGYADNDRALNEAFMAIERSPLPVIAAIGGHCIGGGLELAMACDLRIAAPRATFRMPPAMLGWAYSLRGLERFVSAIGAARARRLFLTAATIDAVTAESWGLIDEVADDWMGRAHEIAEALTLAAPLALAGLKQGLETLAHKPVADDDKARHVARRRAALGSADLLEGRQAFLDRRKPLFQGR